MQLRTWIHGIFLWGGLSTWVQARPLPQTVRDQGGLEDGHNQDAWKFRREYFYDPEGFVSLAKLKAFRKKLQAEQAQFRTAVYETSVIEELELDLVSYDKAKKSASKDASDDKSELMMAFNDYLFPKLDALEALVTASRLQDFVAEKEGLIDDFLKVYAVFFVPSEKDSMTRNMWGMDYNHLDYLKYIQGYTFLRKDPHYIEANNLVVDTDYVSEVRACLGEGIEVGHFLSGNDLNQLALCQFDLSRLHPGRNPLWEPLTHEDRQAIMKEDYSDLFPTSTDKVSFKRWSYSGNGSPKFEATFERPHSQKQKKKKIKVKFGREVHSENASSLLARMVGFNQDIMQHYKELKIYLGDTSYQEFISMFQRKYDFSLMPRFLLAHGGEVGNEWIMVQDVLLESSDDDVSRVGPYDFEGWDLPNRREHRGEVLFFGWVNMADAKAANYKMVLKKGPKGQLIPLYRLHDPGYSLDRSLSVRYLEDVSRLINPEDRGVNIFHPSFLSYDLEKVHLYWADLVFRNGGRYKTSTYQDLKWMARNIAKISDTQILYALTHSHMPEPVADLYWQKLKARRNEMVRAFWLVCVFKAFQVPALEHYSPHEHIQKGQIVTKYFEGHSEYEVRRNTSLTNLFETIGVSLPVFGMTDHFRVHMNAAMMGQATVSPVQYADSALLPGIRLIFGRKVQSNDQRWNGGGSGHGFVIQDTLGIEVGIGSNYLNTIRKYMPVSVKGHLRLFKASIQHTHFADTRKEAYLGPFKLFSMIKDIPHAVAWGLQPGEIISRFDSYGIDLELDVDLHNPGPVRGVASGVGGRFQVFEAAPVHFFRDHFGELNVYKERSRYFGLGLGVNALEFNVQGLEIPVLGMEFTKDRMHHEVAMYAFKLPAYHTQAQALTPAQRAKEGGLLAKLQAHRHLHMFQALWQAQPGDPILHQLDKKFTMQADARAKKHVFGLLFLGNRLTEKGYAKVAIQVGKEAQKFFHRYALRHRDQRGFDRVPIGGNEEMFIERGRSTHVQVEFDEEEDDLGVHVKIHDHLRKTDRDGLIECLHAANERYSLSPDFLFYPDMALLPAKTHIDEYRKIYNEAHIYVGGAAIKKMLSEVSDRDFYTLASKTFGGGRFNVKVLKSMHKFRHLKKSTTVPADYVKATAKWMASVVEAKMGVHMLKELFGPSHMQVYGQIFGLYRSFTMLSRTEQQSTLRYGAQSWGTYKQLTPLRKFLKTHYILPTNIYVDTGFDAQFLLGTLPNGSPPMW